MAERGVPREQYKRTYHVIDGTVPVEEAVALFREIWSDNPATVGPSYDDAGVGDLDYRTAVLHSVPPERWAEFLAWYEKHYPGVEVLFPARPVPGLPDPWDRDITHELVRNNNCTGSLANGWWQRTLDQIVGLTVHHTLSNSPHNTARWYIHKDAQGRPSIPYAIWITQTGEILKCLDFTEGNWHDHTGHKNVHLSIGAAGRLHEYPPTDCQMEALVKVSAWAVRHPEMNITLDMVKGHQDYYRTDCPGWHTGWKHEFYTLLYDELGEKEEPPPDPAPEPPAPTPLKGVFTSFHAQAHAQGDMEYVRAVKPMVWKSCHQAGMARAVQQASPDTLFLYRKVYNDWYKYVYGYDDLAMAARDFIRWLMPEIREIDTVMSGKQWMIEGLNETIATGATEDIRRVVEFESQFAYQIAALPYNVVPCLLNTAVGNPQHGRETEMLIPAAIASIETGGAMGYHPYWPHGPEGTWLEEDWEHFAGRWDASWDKTFRAHGVRPRYVLTESGPIGRNNHHLDALLGWRWVDDWRRTLDEIIRFEKLCRGTVAAKEGRLLGHTLFTTGNVGWELFQYRRPEFEELAAALAAIS